MNDFDRFLERELRVMLDPVVGAEPPARGARRRRLEPSPESLPAEVDAVKDSIPMSEPVPVAVPIPAAQLH